MLNGGANQQDELFNAVSENNVERVSQLLEDDADPNKVNKNTQLRFQQPEVPNTFMFVDYIPPLIDSHPYFTNTTPLCCAVFRENLEITNMLLENGADINKPTQEGWTPLHLAVYTGNLPIINALLDRKPNLEEFTAGEQTALHIAVEKGNINVIFP